MILIADSGSTKTSWLLTDGNKVINTLTTIGYNPYYFNNDSIVSSMKSELLPILSSNVIDNIFFYGSGCSSDENCAMVKNTLLELFPNSIIEVNHDLFGAAVALLKSNEGIACILGTGSNSCRWDGKQIVQNVPSVGYLLGDEGSGTYIGMKILKGILEEKAPTEIISSFYNHYKTSFEGVLNRIYNKPKPNSFISTIGIFAADNISNSWIRNSIKCSFTDFIENQIMQYNNYKDLKVSFTGSIAYYFKEILLEACRDNGITPGIIIKNPIKELFNYHTIN